MLLGSSVVAKALMRRYVKVRRDGHRFSVFLMRHALIRTLLRVRFDPVHVRIRRGVLLSMPRTLKRLSVNPVQALARSHPDGTLKNT